MHVAPLLLKEAVDGDDPAELMTALLQATKDGVPTDHPFRLEAEDKPQGLIAKFSTGKSSTCLKQSRWCRSASIHA